jgi:hypothetical protein
MQRFQDISLIKEQGFTGFHTLATLSDNFKLIPEEQGVYFILYTGKGLPTFIDIGSGGHFKGRNPNVQIEILQSNWTEKSKVIYIGKAGGPGSIATLRSRLRQYIKFGQGSNVGHWGGRYIWQIKNSLDLIICWKTLPKEVDPRNIETDYLLQFKSIYSKRPYANLVN